jgi:hypothetical protein
MPKQVHCAFIAVLLLSISTVHATGACNVTALPLELQGQLKTKFSSWRVQDTANLKENTKQRWQSEKPLACPGIAIGRFEDPTRISYALLLVPLSNPDSAYRLLVFTPNDKALDSVTVA